MGKNAKDKSALVDRLPAACTNERAAVEFLEAQRWGGSPHCAHCGSVSVYAMQDHKGDRHPRFLWRCKDCGKMFTVRVGTVMEESRIPLRFWVLAFWRASASKKGVSALQIKRETGLSYKSALFLMHRIRLAMSSPAGGPRMCGTVEVDEAYVGGRKRKPQGYAAPLRHIGKGGIPRMNTGRGTTRMPVYAILERGGRVHAAPMERITARTLRDAIRDHVHHSARIITDESPFYAGLGDEFAGGHETVQHSTREYVRGDVTTNTVEGFFSLLKRGVYGTYHSVSRKHLGRYLDEFAFRYNNRNVEDGERTARAIKGAEGKRLPSRSLSR